jgi:hypothetical protein
MTKPAERGDRAARQAAALAREIGGGIPTVLLTHFADAATLDTFRPGETDLATVAAVNRAVARELAQLGTAVFVQRADAGAFRRWLDGKEDTAKARRAWVDRDRLLRGEEAFRLLGLNPVAPPRRPGFGKAPGPIADRILDAFEDEEGEDLHALLSDLLDAGREDAIDLACRKLADEKQEEAALDLLHEARAAAEAGPRGPSGWAAVMTMPVAMPQGQVPDAEALAASLREAGVLDEMLELRFLPGWRNPKDIVGMSPAALRRVLEDLVAGREPLDLPPGDTDELTQDGFGVLVGLQVDWAIPSWESIAAEQAEIDAGIEPPEDDPEEEARQLRFDAWATGHFTEADGHVPLPPCPPSQLLEAITAFVDAAEGSGPLAQLAGFVEMAREEAGGEEVLCRVTPVGTGVELLLLTAGGRALDSMVIPEADLPVPAEHMAKLMARYVQVQEP